MLKKVSLGLLATLVLGLGIFGVVGAQDSGDDLPPDGSGAHVEVIESVAELLGMTADELKEAVQNGQTIAELAAAQSVALDDIVDVLIAPIAANLRERLENGQPVLPRPQQRPQQPMRPSNRQTAVQGAALNILADVLGLPIKDVREALGDGQTVSELAAAQGVPTDEVVDALVLPVSERLDQAVAAGKMTREDADAKLVEVTAKIQEQIESGDFRPRPPARPAPRSTAGQCAPTRTANCT